MALFIRLLAEEDKGAALAQAVAAVMRGESDPRVFQVEPESFRQVPGAPFAYWVSEGVRSKFLHVQAFQSGSRSACLGASTKYDFRFVRLWWEVLRREGDRWSTYANGGHFSRFYCSYRTIIKSQDEFGELAEYLIDKFPYLKGNPGWILHLENDYTRPAIGWPLRTHSFSPHLLPGRTVFSARTYAAYVPVSELTATCGLLASCPADFLLKLMLGRFGHPEFVTAVVRALPWPGLQGGGVLGDLALRAWSLKRSLDTAELTSHAFTLPALLQVEGTSLAERARNWVARVADTDAELARIQAEIDERCFDLYGFDPADRAAALSASAGSAGGEPLTPSLSPLSHGEGEEDEA